MKKPYMPLSINLYTLSTGSTSTGCSGIPYTPGTPQEIPEWDNETVFNDANCDWDASDICYDIPLESSSVFQS